MAVPWPLHCEKFLSGTVRNRLFHWQSCFGLTMWRFRTILCQFDVINMINNHKIKLQESMFIELLQAFPLTAMGDHGHFQPMKSRLVLLPVDLPMVCDVSQFLAERLQLRQVWLDGGGIFEGLL